jgi:hypothetical protein
MSAKLEELVTKMGSCDFFTELKTTTDMLMSPNVVRWDDLRWALDEHVDTIIMAALDFIIQEGKSGE